MSKLLKDVVDYLKETQGLSMSQISKDLGKGRNYIREAIERDISMDKQMEILFKLYCRGLGYKDLLDIIQQQATKYQVTQEQADEFERQLISVNEENRKLEKHCASLRTTLEHRNKGLSEAQKQIKAKDLAIDSLNRGANNRRDMYNIAMKEMNDMAQDLEKVKKDRDELYESQGKHLTVINKISEQNKNLEHQIVVLQNKIDEDQKEYVKGEVAQDKEIDRLNELLAKEKKVASYLVGVERRADELEKELFDEKEACDIGSKQIDYQNEIIKGFRTKCKDLEIDANNWQRTSKLWKLLFIMTSIFLLALALYHAF